MSLAHEKPAKIVEELSEKLKQERQVKLYKRGAVTCTAPLILLAAMAHFLSLHTYVYVAVGIQLAVFLLHGLPSNSEKFYDLSGSFTHLSLVVVSLFEQRLSRSPRQLFVAVASVMWMTRLGCFLYSRILKDGKDARFDRIKPCWLSFLGAWLIQALWVAIIQLPVILLNTTPETGLAATTTSTVDIIGMVLWFIGFLIEAAADSEKLAFSSNPENKGKYITTGLWSLSRHPNYFGEILMWTSMALIATSSCFAAGAGSTTTVPPSYSAWFSPMLTCLLLLKVSGVPMVESAGQKKWGTDPRYNHYMSKTSCVVPWLPAGPMKKKSE